MVKLIAMTINIGGVIPMNKVCRWSVYAIFLMIIGGLSLTYVYAEETEYISEPKEIDQALIEKILDQKKAVMKSIFESLSTLEHHEAMLTDGHIVIAAHGGLRDPILLFRINKAGNIIWDENVAQVRTKGYKYSPDVIAGPGGSCFVSWRQTSPNGFFIRKFSKNGENVWTTKVPEKDIFYYDMILTQNNGIALVGSGVFGVKAFHILVNGDIAWRKEGITLGFRSHSGDSHNPVSLIRVNKGRDIIAVWYKFSTNNNVFVAQRLNIKKGNILWKEPVVLGPAPMFALVVPRKIELKYLNDSVEAFLYKGIAGDAGFKIENYNVRINLDGDVIPVDS